MSAMTLVEWVQIGMGLGVFSGGVGFGKWCITVERRLYKLEVKTEVSK